METGSVNSLHYRASASGRYGGPVVRDDAGQWIRMTGSGMLQLFRAVRHTRPAPPRRQRNVPASAPRTTKDLTRTAGGGTGLPLAPRISTSRLTIRRWSLADAGQLRESILVSLNELRPVFAWAVTEPTSVRAATELLHKLRRDFEAGHRWPYGIFDIGETMVLGGIELRPGRRRGDRELSYWIRTSCTRRGYATEAVSAITGHLFSDPLIDRTLIRCQRTNTRGAAIPERLGYCLRNDEASRLDDGAEGAMVWELSRTQFSAVAGLPAQPRPWLI